MQEVVRCSNLDFERKVKEYEDKGYFVAHYVWMDCNKSFVIVFRKYVPSSNIKIYNILEKISKDIDFLKEYLLVPKPKIPDIRPMPNIEPNAPYKSPYV